MLLLWTHWYSIWYPTIMKYKFVFIFFNDFVLRITDHLRPVHRIRFASTYREKFSVFRDHHSILADLWPYSNNARLLFLPIGYLFLASKPAVPKKIHVRGKNTYFKLNFFFCKTIKILTRCLGYMHFLFESSVSKTAIGHLKGSFFDTRNDQITL